MDNYNFQYKPTYSRPSYEPKYTQSYEPEVQIINYINH